MAERAVKFASRLQNEELAVQISERLELYKQQEPYTEDPVERKLQPATAVSNDELEPGSNNFREVPL